MEDVDELLIPVVQGRGASIILGIHVRAVGDQQHVRLALPQF